MMSQIEAIYKKIFSKQNVKIYEKKMQPATMNPTRNTKEITQGKHTLKKNSTIDTSKKN